MQEKIKEIRDLITKAKLRQAFVALSELAESVPDNRTKEILNLKSAFNQLKRDSILVIQPDEDFQVAENKIIAEILNILTKIEGKNTELKYTELDNSAKKELKDLIAEGKSENALEILINSKEIIHPLINDRIIELSKDLEKTKKDWHLGIMQYDRYSGLRNKVTYNLLEIIDVINQPEFISTLDSTISINQFDKDIDPELCFVIISYDPKMEPIYEGIRDAALKFGLKAKRVKEVIGDYEINDKIIEMIKSARFIVSDLSMQRPNVYFEHGFARGLGKDIITICREGEKIHFDVQGWTTILYSDSRILEKQLINRFEAELNK